MDTCVARTSGWRVVVRGFSFFVIRLLLVFVSVCV